MEGYDARLNTRPWSPSADNLKSGTFQYLTKIMFYPATHQQGPFIPSLTLLPTKLMHMEVLFLLIGISLIIAVLFLVAFLKASKDGQFEDDYTPSIRILFPENDNSKDH